MVDQGLTKGVIFIPCKKTFTALDTANSYINDVYKRFGLPSILISDRGPQFTSKVFEELCKIFGINHRKSTAFHPQTDGESERLNQELETYLRLFCADHVTRWKEYLPFAEFAHNQRTHQSTKMSPFEIMYGTEVVAIPTAFPRINVPAAEDRFKIINQIRDEALAAHELSRQLMMQRVKGKMPHFKEGDQVWLDSRNLKIAHESRKFAPRREGPFTIEKVLGPVTFRLNLPPRWKIHPVFHASLLTPYHENETHGPNYLRPSPDLIEGAEEFEIESIISHRRKGNQWEFLIKWKGYPSSENTWQKGDNLEHSQETLDTYKEHHNLPNKPPPTLRPTTRRNRRS